jgi:hypothetical protein
MFDGSSKWRLEIPSNIIACATSSKTIPLNLCIHLTHDGIQALGPQGAKMDVLACIKPTAGAVDGEEPFTWKKVAELHPTLSLVAIISLDWHAQGIPEGVVLMLSAVAQGSADVLIRTSMLDEATPSSAPFAAANQGGGAAASPGVHIATLPMNMISAFIGTKGANVKELSRRYGQSCRINVEKSNGMVTTTDCNNEGQLYEEIQAFIANGAAGMGVPTQPMSAGGRQNFGGGRNSRGRNGGGRSGW